MDEVGDFSSEALVEELLKSREDLAGRVRKMNQRKVLEGGSGMLHVDESNDVDSL